MVIYKFLQKVDLLSEFAQLALNVVLKLDAKITKPEVLMLMAADVLHHKSHLKETLPVLRESYSTALEVGNLIFAAHSGYYYCLHSFLCGHPLNVLKQDAITYYNVSLQLNQLLSANCCRIYWQSSLNLLNLTEYPTILSGSALQETEFLPMLISVNDYTGLYYFYLFKLILCFLFEEIEPAHRYSMESRNHLSAIGATIGQPVFYFYDSLTALAIFSKSIGQESEILERVAQNQTKLQFWSDNAPMNHQHKVDLVEAEKCRVLGKNYEAGDLYDCAITGAKENEYIQEEALTNELAAKFYLDRGKEKVAAGYMQEAYYCYARWGAKAKVADLEQRYPQLLQPILQQPKSSFNALETLTNISHSSTQVSSSRTSDSLDFASIIQAAQALSSTIELDELLKQLTQIILQNVGADKCVLVLPQDEIWQVRAISTLETTELCSEPLDNHPNVPSKLIQYVKRTQSVVVIDNLQTDLPVIDDYLIQHNPKSILCLPILNQGHLAGILCLKNQSTAGVFTSDKLTIIEFLCTQAAISLENARLYQESQQTLVELQTSKVSFQKLADNLPGAIYQIRITADGSTSMPYVSSGFIALYEISPEDFKQGVTNLRQMEHPDDSSRVLQAVLYSAENLTPFREELRIITPSGKVKWLQFSSRPERQADGSTVWDGVILDVSDRKQAEADRQQKSEALEKALEELQTTQIQMIQGEKMSALGNLVAGVAHEINNPIGFIAGNLNEANQGLEDLIDYVHLYQEKFPEPGVEVVEKAEKIDLDYLIEDLPKMLKSMQTGCDRIKFISKSLRTFSRSDTDQKQIFDLHEGIDSTILILRHRLKANEQHPSIEVVTNYGNLPPINCFPGQLNQVFMNILANAIDALDESNHGRSFAEIKANPNEITITTTVEDNYIKVVIADNGKGMSEEVKAKVFDHLFTTKGVGKGTGLGLAIARQIVVERHGGSLEVESQIGQGTKFLISLPIKG